MYNINEAKNIGVIFLKIEYKTIFFIALKHSEWKNNNANGKIAKDVILKIWFNSDFSIIKSDKKGENKYRIILIRIDNTDINCNILK